MNQDKREQIYIRASELLAKGNSLTLLSIEGIGRGDFIDTLRDKSSDKCVFLTMNLDELPEISETNILRLFLTRIIQELTSTESSKDLSNLNNSLSTTDSFILTSAIRSALGELLATTSKAIVIELSELRKGADLSKSFFSSLRSFRELDKNRVGFMFVDNTSFFPLFTPENSGELFELMSSLVIYIPFGDDRKFMKVINDSEKRFNYKVSAPNIKFIKEMVGHHAGLAKYLVLYFAENNIEKPEILKILEYPAVNIRIERIVKELSDSDKKVLLEIHKGETVSESSDHVNELIEKHFLKNIDGKYSLSIPILGEYLGLLNKPINKNNTGLKNDTEQSISLVIENGTVFIDGKMLEEDLTSSELDILNFMLSNSGGVVSREEIADVIWGEHANIKYSDWAIDKAISRLRKKIQTQSKRRLIKTLKGRGFKLQL